MMFGFSAAREGRVTAKAKNRIGKNLMALFFLAAVKCGNLAKCAPLIKKSMPTSYETTGRSPNYPRVRDARCIGGSTSRSPHPH